jgi:hypothetical protein
MQSLGQAIYRYVCQASTGGATISAITSEMCSRGYLIPQRGGTRVRAALEQYLSMGKITLSGRLYIKTTHLEIII